MSFMTSSMVIVSAVRMFLSHFVEFYIYFVSNIAITHHFSSIFLSKYCTFLSVLKATRAIFLSISYIKSMSYYHFHATILLRTSNCYKGKLRCHLVNCNIGQCAILDLSKSHHLRITAPNQTSAKSNLC